jgi:hypothetical protein
MPSLRSIGAVEYDEVERAVPAAATGRAGGSRTHVQSGSGRSPGTTGRERGRLRTVGAERRVFPVPRSLIMAARAPGMVESRGRRSGRAVGHGSGVTMTCGLRWCGTVLRLGVTGAAAPRSSAGGAPARPDRHWQRALTERGGSAAKVQPSTSEPARSPQTISRTGPRVRGLVDRRGLGTITLLPSDSERGALPGSGATVGRERSRRRPSR